MTTHDSEATVSACFCGNSVYSRVSVCKTSILPRWTQPAPRTTCCPLAVLLTETTASGITPSTGTLNGSIKLLARALRVPECRNKMDQMMALRSRLDGTNWVIVIDEAQHLKYAALEEIRSLTDDNPMTGEHGVGVVLIGNSEVYSRLQGRQQAQFAQLFSRIRMQREYTTRKVKEDDVRKLFPVLAEQDARKEMDFLLSVCRSPWGIRGAMNLYTNAASANDVSYENLYRMAAHMGIGMLGAV